MKTKTISSLKMLMEERSSVRKYDPNFEISKDEIEEMLNEAVTAPSSSNLQPWRFMIFTNKEMKQELRTIAFNQEQVETASAVIAVLGDVEMYKNVEKIYDENVQAGFMDQSIRDSSVEKTLALYPQLPVEARKNIAFFDAGLVAMQLMLVAKSKGYDTVPMGGFDKEAFVKKYSVPENQFPIILLSLGKATEPAFRTTRLDVQDVALFL